MKKDRYFGLSPRIAKWKIDTPLENYLSFKADKSEFWKKIYVEYYKISDRKYYRGGVKFISQILDTYKDKLSCYDKNRITRDMIYCLHRFGLSFEDYCIYELADKDFHYRNSFVSDKLRHHYCDLLNSKAITPLLNDKYECYKKYKEFFKRDVLGCYTQEDKSTFLDFAKKHERFIVKPLNGNCGKGVRIVSLIDKDASAFWNEMTKDGGTFIVEELIIQGKELAALHPQSINSLRVSTFVLGGKVHIIAIVQRIGVGDSVVDNAGSGGIYASVDVEHGFIQTDARNYKGQHFNIHPDTGVQIVGYKLPEWDKAISMIQKIATCQEGSTLIAWDIAYSDKGWIMVEGNAVGSWDVLQSNKQIGKKAELFAYMDEYFRLKKQ